jgi:hypothetical protein
LQCKSLCPIFAVASAEPNWLLCFTQAKK